MIELELERQRQRLLDHPLVTQLTSVQAWHVFMEHHVFAVWDFMSLLKRLQNELTCVSVPWVPRAAPHFGRFIHEIVLAEESDSDGAGGYSSHFDLYLAAMDTCGADTTRVRHFVELVRQGVDTAAALTECGVAPCVGRFVGHTLEVAQNGSIEEVCAAFFWGRENIIPGMFTALAATLRRVGEEFAPLEYYLLRHIELDGDSHGPLAQQLLDALCDGDPQRRARANRAAARSLQARWDLWTGVDAAITARLATQTSVKIA